MPYCRNCGKEVSENAVQCPECGEVFKKGSSATVVAGYVCAGLSLIIFPIGLGIAGLVLGIINVTKGRTGHGIAQIILSVVLGTIGALLGMAVWSSI
jgi:hypothetical protein